MNSPSQLIPVTIMYPKTFMSRMYFDYDPEVNRWIPDLEASDLSLDEQVAEWISAFRHEVRFMSPPSHSLYREGDTKQLIIAGVSVMYVPSVEEPDDTDMGEMAGTTKPTITASARVV